MKYSLVGVDGNAYSIMGYTAKVLELEGLYDLVDEMYAQATGDDYDNLVAVCMQYVDIAMILLMMKQLKMVGEIGMIHGKILKKIDKYEKI